MIRAAHRSPAPAAAALAAITLALTAAPALADKSPLTHKYPLGTQTLCCQSHTATTPTHTATTPRTPRAKPTTPAQPSHQTTVTPTHHSSGIPLWLPIGMLALAFVLAAVSRRVKTSANRARRDYRPRPALQARPPRDRPNRPRPGYNRPRLPTPAQAPAGPASNRRPKLRYELSRRAPDPNAPEPPRLELVPKHPKTDD